MDNNSAAYWKATLGLLTKILVIWFVVSRESFLPRLSTPSVWAATRSVSGSLSKVRSTCSSR